MKNRLKGTLTNVAFGTVMALVIAVFVATLVFAVVGITTVANNYGASEFPQSLRSYTVVDAQGDGHGVECRKVLHRKTKFHCTQDSGDTLYFYRMTAVFEHYRQDMLNQQRERQQNAEGYGDKRHD